MEINGAVMMHYSSWLIGVKTMASLRNEKNIPNTDWNNRGNAVEMQKNNAVGNEKTSEQNVVQHLWKKGKTSFES